MVKNHKKSQKNKVLTVCGVDTLYFQLCVEYDNYTKFYQKSKTESATKFLNMEILAENWDKRYTYFAMFDGDKRVARIGFKDLNTNDNLEQIHVQMESPYMGMNTVKDAYYFVVENLGLLGLDIQRSKIQRFDLNTYVYGHDFSYLDYYYFSTLVRKKGTVYGDKGDLETFTLGKRDNRKSPFLRLYNKWAELFKEDKTLEKQAIIRSKFLKKFNVELDIDVPLWNVEFELKRDFLRSYGLDTVEDCLAAANTIHNDLMSSIRLLKNKREPQDKNLQRFETAAIWEQIKDEYDFEKSDKRLEKIVQKKYFKDAAWFKNRAVEYISQMNPDSEEFYRVIMEIKEIYEKRNN